MDSSNYEFAQIQSAGAAPDWASVAQDLHCPLCEYNLRGLVEPRCPECGHRFNWAALQDERLRRHPWLFEHHPESNRRSWIKTFWMSRFPRRFWREVLSTHDIRLGRLLLYGVVSLVMSSLPLAIILISLGAAQQALNPYISGQTLGAPPIPGPSVIIAWIQNLPDTAEHIFGPLISIAAFYVALPWLTLLALMIFRISMRNRGIRTVHVVRCIVYSADAAAWTNGVMILATIPAVLAVLYFQTSPLDDTPLLPVLCLWLAAWVTFAYRIYIAYRHYLGFDRPFATIAATQLLLALAFVTAAISFGQFNPFLDNRYWFRWLGY